MSLHGLLGRQGTGQGLVDGWGQPERKVESSTIRKLPKAAKEWPDGMIAADCDPGRSCKGSSCRRLPSAKRYNRRWPSGKFLLRRRS